MRKMRGGPLVVLFVFGFVFFMCREGHSLSFRLYDRGGDAQGQAGAYTAQADNPSAIYYNPGAVATLNGQQVLIGNEFLLLETDYTSRAGVKESSDNDWALVPHLFATTHLRGNWSLGFGAYSLFGLATEYSDKGVLRYVATTSELKTMTLSPVVSYQLTPEFSLGGGLNILLGNLDLRNKIDFGALAGISGGADGDFRIDAEGEGIGFNLGALYQPHTQHRFGISFHSPVDLELDGDIGITNIPSFVGVGSGISGSLSTEIDLPLILRGGYAFYPNEKWKLEFDVEWTNFSEFESLDLESTNPLAPTSSIPQDYDDAYVFALGTQYLFNNNWIGRLGYGHILEAVPEATFSPIIPGSDRNFFTAGLEYHWCSLSIGAAYQFILFEDRSIDNDVGGNVGSTVDGTYESHVHGIVLDIHVSF